VLRDIAIMNVAIPVLKNQIAPCFEAAKQFEIFSIKNKKIVSSKVINCFANEGFMRIRLLRLYEIHTLICNGIKNFYRDQLNAMGIFVLPNVNQPVGTALNLFLLGDLKNYEPIQMGSENKSIVSHDDLVYWAEELFKKNGYLVFPCPDKDSYLVDLIANINCPLCSRQIKVAICCGAQIYKAEQEIKEFHHNTKTQYNARVYVYLMNPQLEKSCNDYGIEFLSPENKDKTLKQKGDSVIPILQRPVEGHEKAYNLSL
jgi:predicted Fe-Mo cluster-binding NifX family protein